MQKTGIRDKAGEGRELKEKRKKRETPEIVD